MLPPCTTCVPSCSLFPRSAGGKVILPPLTESPQDCTMTRWRQEAPIKSLSTMHPPCSCHRHVCICPSSSSGRPPLQHEPASSCSNGYDPVLHRRGSIGTHSDAPAINGPLNLSKRTPIPPPTQIPSPHGQQITHPPTTTAAISPSTDDPTAHQATIKPELTSSVRTFRFKNASTCSQNTNRRETKSPSRRPSPSDTDGSLKEINITRRARRQIYLKPDVEGSPFRLLMYVDCRSVEPQPEPQGQ